MCRRGNHPCSIFKICSFHSLELELNAVKVRLGRNRATGAAGTCPAWELPARGWPSWLGSEGAGRASSPASRPERRWRLRCVHEYLFGWTVPATGPHPKKAPRQDMPRSQQVSVEREFPRRSPGTPRTDLLTFHSKGHKTIAAQRCQHGIALGCLHVRNAVRADAVLMQKPAVIINSWSVRGQQSCTSAMESAASNRKTGEMFSSMAAGS